MHSDHEAQLCELVNNLGGIAISFAAIFIPFAIVVWPTTIDCQVATGPTACQAR